MSSTSPRPSSTPGSSGSRPRGLRGRTVADVRRGGVRIITWPLLAAITILDALAAGVRAIDDALAELPDDTEPSR